MITLGPPSVSAGTGLTVADCFLVAAGREMFSTLKINDISQLPINGSSFAVPRVIFDEQDFACNHR